MNSIDLARDAGVAGVKFTPVAAFIGVGAVSVPSIQACAYSLAALYALLQIIHLVWQWRNERAAIKRKLAALSIRPRTPMDAPHVSH